MHTAVIFVIYCHMILFLLVVINSYMIKGMSKSTEWWFGPNRQNFHHTSLTETSELGTRCPSGQKWPVASVKRRHQFPDREHLCVFKSFPTCFVFPDRWPFQLCYSSAGLRLSATTRLNWCVVPTWCLVWLLTISESSDLIRPGHPKRTKSGPHHRLRRSATIGRQAWDDRLLQRRRS